MTLPLDHPFSEFNNYLYMESGTPKLPIYIWKKGNKGILVELHLNDKENGPRGRIFSMKFYDEYNFDLEKCLGDVIRPTLDELYSGLADIIRRRLNQDV